MKSGQIKRLPNVTKRRKKWLVNGIRGIFLRLTRFRRDKHTWLFGCWEGDRYDDNARALFEYVCATEPSIKAIWLTKNQTVLSKLEADGRRAYLFNTKEANAAAKRAGVALYTHGIDDFGLDSFCYGAKLICLTHSISGIKQDYYSSRTIGPVKRIIKKCMDFIFDWYKFDYCIVSSITARDWRMNVHWNHTKRRYPITGLPRNDELRGYDERGRLCPVSCPKSEKYILFLPTYRPYENSVILELVQNIQSDKELLDFLSSKKTRLLIKPHNADYNSVLELPKNDSITLLLPNQVESTQKLMKEASVLITDYSSACMDFALLNRPVLLYAPDYQKYDECHGIVPEWLSVYSSPAAATDYATFREQLMNAVEGRQESYSLSKRIRSLYEDESIRDTSYCKNVVSFLKRKVKL